MSKSKKTAPKKANVAAFKFGWLPDLPDARDLMYASPIAVMKALPNKIDLRPKCPPILNQGGLGSCTANALGTAFQFGQKKQKVANFIPSRLFIYYNERVYINTINSDSGAYIRDGIKTLNKDGACPETIWTYDDSSTTGSKFTQKPPAACYANALKNQILSYQRLNNSLISQLKGCLAEGFPFVFGFTVYSSFRNITSNGNMPIPNFNTESVLGGHAVTCVGFDDVKQMFIIQNSWGASWGDGGYFYMPYSYITSNLSNDFWTIRLVEGVTKKAAAKKKSK
jgi:C1A family cysteine protease